MQRLIQENKNTPREYDRIFKERSKKGPDWQDLRRWKTLLKYYKGGMILDIGCLDSNIPEYIIADDYLGVDVSSHTIDQMRKKYKKAHYIHGRLEEMEMSERFDYVVIGEVLEHIEDPKRMIKRAFELTKPEGILAISVPLNEADEPGAVDGDRHLWSFDGYDLEEMVWMYSKQIKTKILRSRLFPSYNYCWPQLILWAWKK